MCADASRVAVEKVSGNGIGVVSGFNEDDAFSENVVNTDTSDDTTMKK